MFRKNNHNLNEKIKVIFVDIDNTLFDHLKKHNFDFKSIKALNKVQQKGCQIIVCSARPLYSLKALGVFDYITPDGLISSNGAYRLYKGEWFDRYIYPKDDLNAIINICKKYDLCAEFITPDDRFYINRITDEVHQHHNVCYEPLAKVSEYANQDIVAVLLFLKREKHEFIQNQLPKEVRMIPFTDYGFDVVTKKHNKGEAVLSMIKKMNLNKSNALAFGDDIQDIAMFENVGYGIAMDNAKEELKQISFAVTKAVNKHGIYKFLKKECMI